MTQNKTEPNRVIFFFLNLDRGSLVSKCQKDWHAVNHLNYPNNITGSTENKKRSKWSLIRGVCGFSEECFRLWGTRCSVSHFWWDGRFKGVDKFYLISSHKSRVTWNTYRKIKPQNKKMCHSNNFAVEDSKGAGAHDLSPCPVENGHKKIAV